MSYRSGRYIQKLVLLIELIMRFEVLDFLQNYNFVDMCRLGLENKAVSLRSAHTYLFWNTANISADIFMKSLALHVYLGGVS